MKKRQVTKANNGVFALNYEMVLVTKWCRPVLTGPMIDQARAIAGERCGTRGGTLVDFRGAPEHLRLSLHLPPTAALADFANALKTSTSRLLRRDHPELQDLGETLWAPSYFVASRGEADNKTIEDYIRAQSHRDPAKRRPV